MSFFCPHFIPATERCERVRAPCVPGRAGCVAARNSVFAVPPQERIDGAARPPKYPPAPPLPPLRPGRT
ncbi:MAG: hypothetical protein LBK99_21635 [Opitutaceae bacterium]|jgi:hypothetical protein|nr:hypothetical protein [Opitutaceae bacterium]